MAANTEARQPIDALLKKRNRTGLVASLLIPRPRRTRKKRPQPAAYRGELGEDSEKISVESVMDSMISSSKRRNADTTPPPLPHHLRKDTVTDTAADRMLTRLSNSMRMADSCNDFLVQTDLDTPASMTKGAALSHQHSWSTFRFSPGFKMIPPSVKHHHSAIDSDLISSIGNQNCDVASLISTIKTNNYTLLRDTAHVVTIGDARCSVYDFWVTAVPCYKFCLVVSYGLRVNVVLDYVYINMS